MVLVFQVATSEPPSPPPVPVTLTVAPPREDAALYSPPPPYEPTDGQPESVPGNVIRFNQPCLSRKIIIWNQSMIIEISIF